MKKLSLENTELVALVDDVDYEGVSKHRWYLNSNGYVYGYFGNNKRLLLHRYILGISGRQKQVDHKNRNPLDCRRENLRICNNRQNTGNTSKRKTNKSGYKGVCWAKRFKKWRATITDNSKQIHIGYFNSLDEAAKAYDKMATKVFGEFAGLNFPNEDNTYFDDGITRRPPSNCITPGVYLTKWGRYVAHIKIDGKRTYLGSFSSEEEAATAIERVKIG